MNLTTKVMSLSALLALGSISNPVFAQEAVMNTTAVQSSLARGYVRPSLTVLYVTDGSSEAEKVLSELQELNTEQFYYNPVSLPSGRLNVEAKNDKELVGQLKSYAENLIKENNIGQSIMHCWFPKFDEENKSYALNVLASRGAYGATDADVLAAEASKRGKDARLMELGERMIDRSYVQVVYLTTERTEKTVKNNIYSVLYKLDFGPEVRTNFYEKGFDSADGIDKVEFPLNFVASTKPVTVREKEIDETYDELLTRMSQVNSDFQVQSPVLDVHPLRAKIGKKEGLKVDDRFYVMEMVQKADGTIKDTRRSTFRVTKKIADNRKEADGHSEEYTSFYQVAGGGYDKGMTLVSKKDIGMSVLPIISNNFVGAEIEQRVSKWIGVPGTFVFVRIGLPMGANGIDGEKFGPVKFDYTDTDGKKQIGSMVQWGAGARKEFNFARFLNFAAHASFNGYYLLMSGDRLRLENGRTLEKSLSAYTVAAGVRLGVQVVPSLGFFVGADYGFTFGEDKDIIQDDVKVSPVSVSLGARISF